MLKAVVRVCAGSNSYCANAYQDIDYDFDDMGNLSKQHNLITGFAEEYVYDELKRVEAAWPGWTILRLTGRI